MIRLFLVTAILIGVAIFILKILRDFFAGLQGTTSMALKDFNKLRDYLDLYELAPWDPSEVDLISRNYEVSAERGLLGHEEHGVFFSIYNEPIFAFANKPYEQNNRELIAIKVNNSIYQFDIHNDKVVKFLKNGKPAGRLNIEHGVQMNYKGVHVNIDVHSLSELVPLNVNRAHKISIAGEDKLTGMQGRMLHQTGSLTEVEGEIVLLSVAFALANKQI